MMRRVSVFHGPSSLDPLVVARMSQETPVLYGKYQLLEQIARGGMAELFKAKAHGVEGFEKILVIKRILPELSENPRFVDMFINEEDRGDAVAREHRASVRPR
jgi:hypothetical protein